jgi:DNA-binding GntR family transcriptional regulator
MSSMSRAHEAPNEDESAKDSTLWQEDYHRIRDGILRGDFPLGTVLNRKKLAADLRMSLLPVSEALRRLQLDGLVETERRAGTRVRIPTSQDVEDHLVVRAALECESARRFCQLATAEERQDIVARAGHLDHLHAHSGNLAANKKLSYVVHSYHQDFHLRIVDGARCRTLRGLIEQNQVLTWNWLYNVASESEILPADFHADLARALSGDNAEEAARAMREHVWFGWENLVRAFTAKYWDGGEGRNSAQRWRMPETARV